MAIAAMHGNIRCMAAIAMAGWPPAFPSRSCPTGMRKTGISYTVSVAPQKAHLSDEEPSPPPPKAFDMYFDQGGFHIQSEVDGQGNARRRNATS